MLMSKQLIHGRLMKQRERSNDRSFWRE